MKIKLIEVGEGFGTLLLPLPTSVLEAVGWTEGDEVDLDVSMAYPDTLILTKKEEGPHDY